MTVTNAMRLLKQANIRFDTSEYEVDESDLSGVHAAAMLDVDPDCVFKTLVARGGRNGLYVFVIPVAEELDLKKAAAAAGEKSLAMMHVRDLEAVCGYVRGACSPVGMKKSFRTLIDETAQLYDKIGISGGRKGVTLTLDPVALVGFIGATLADITL